MSHEFVAAVRVDDRVTDTRYSATCLLARTEVPERDLALGVLTDARDRKGTVRVKLNRRRLIGASIRALVVGIRTVSAAVIAASPAEYEAAYYRGQQDQAMA